MMNSSRLIRVGALASFAAALLLAFQFVIGAPLGGSLVLLERSLDANALASFLRESANTLRWLMMADYAFIISFTIAFVGFAASILAQSRLAAVVALFFALLTTVVDLTENSLTLAAVTLASTSAMLDTPMLIVLNVLAQLKFLFTYVAATLFAVSIWSPALLNRTVAVLFLIFPLLGVLAVVSVEVGLLRVLWMFVLLIAGGIFLWREALVEKE